MSLNDLSEDLEREIMKFKGYSRWHINAVVQKLYRKIDAEEWLPNRKKYVYHADITLYLPYYNAANKREDAYSYNIVYTKDKKTGKAIDIGSKVGECWEAKHSSRMGKESVYKENIDKRKKVEEDPEKRLILPKLYTNDLFKRVYDLSQEPVDTIRDEINAEEGEDEMKLKFIYVDMNGLTATDGKSYADHVLCAIEALDIVVDGQDNVKMQQFKELVVKAMMELCNRLFAHNIQPVAIEEISKEQGNVKEMFQIPESIVTGNFWSNLIGRIKVEEKVEETRELENWENRQVPEAIRINRDYYREYVNAFFTQVVAKQKKRPAICYKSEKYIGHYVDHYVVEAKFPLIRNTTYSLAKKGFGRRIPMLVSELKF